MIKKSFTLIELLVVIAIIGTLSAVLLPNFMDARQRARDSARKNDLRQIEKALELYRQGKNPPAYPTATSNGFGVNCGSVFSDNSINPTPVYLNKIPCDPLGPTRYFYQPDNINLSYQICTCLENIADPEPTPSFCSGLTCPSNKKKYGIFGP